MRRVSFAGLAPRAPKRPLGLHERSHPGAGSQAHGRASTSSWPRGHLRVTTCPFPCGHMPTSSWPGVHPPTPRVFWQAWPMATNALALLRLHERPAPRQSGGVAIPHAVHASPAMPFGSFGGACVFGMCVSRVGWWQQAHNMWHGGETAVWRRGHPPRRARLPRHAVRQLRRCVCVWYALGALGDGEMPFCCWRQLTPCGMVVNWQSSGVAILHRKKQRGSIAPAAAATAPSPDSHTRTHQGSARSGVSARAAPRPTARPPRTSGRAEAGSTSSTPPSRCLFYVSKYSPIEVSVV